MFFNWRPSAPTAFKYCIEGISCIENTFLQIISNRLVQNCFCFLLAKTKHVLICHSYKEEPYEGQGVLVVS